MAHVLPTAYLKNCTDGFFTCFGNWANAVTNGIWWTALLLGFCMALYAATMRYGNTRAFGFASIVGLFGAMFMATIGWMAWWIASGFILVGIIGTAMMILSER